MLFAEKAAVDAGKGFERSVEQETFDGGTINTYAAAFNGNGAGCGIGGGHAGGESRIVEIAAQAGHKILNAVGIKEQAGLARLYKLPVPATV